MKVDDDKRAQQRALDKHQKQPESQGKDPDKKSFSNLMDRQRAPGGYRRGDERQRELKEGTMQTRDRELGKRCDERRQGSKGGDKRARHGDASAVGNRDPRCDERGQRRAVPGDVDDEEQRSCSPGLGGVEEYRGGADKARCAAASESASRPPSAMMHVAQEIVEAVRVGDDAGGRRVLFVDVTIPGRGDVRIRLRREGQGMEVRMRADNDALARSLQQGVGQLRRAGQDRGIDFISVQVVR